MRRRDFIKLNAFACAAAAAPVALNRLVPHYRSPKAKSVVVLYMVGGPSQMELFDYKPDLFKYDGKTLETFTDDFSEDMRKNLIIKPLKKFKQYGQSGQWVSDYFPNIATIVDDLTFIKNFTAREDNHSQAQLEFCTGVNFPGHPHVGAWLNYALNKPQGKLPKNFILTDPNGLLRIGDLAWNSNPLPSNATTMFKFSGVQETLDILKNTKVDQQFINTFSQLEKMNPFQKDFESLLQKRLDDFNLINSMRDPIMKILDLSDESNSAQSLYALEDPVCRPLGEQLLVARKLVEQEVPFIKVYCGNDTEKQNWDHHINFTDLDDMAYKADKPIAGFIKDLKQRGLLDSTIVVWAGEFGRRPAIDKSKSMSAGRSHNIHAGTIWLAGAGIKKGFSIGETDELSYKTVGDRIEMGDVWATVFHLMGVDHQKVTMPTQNGAEMRLTRTYNRVLHEILS